MRRLILALALLALSPGHSQAQIVGIELKDARTARRYRKWILPTKARTTICGEVLEGLKIDLQANPPRISKPASAKEIILLIPDPARPELELARFDRRGRRKILARKRRLTIDARDVRSYRLVYSFQNCAGLRTEYLRKLAGVQALEGELKSIKLGTPEWFETQRRLLPRMDALVAWLRATLFPLAADKLQKQYRAWIKKAGKDASRSRLEEAKDSYAPFTPPATLQAAAKRFGRPELTFHGAATLHLRAIAHEGVPIGVLENGLLLGERIIEGFRSELIDPYLGARASDPIPEGLFEEFLLCPDEQQLAVRFLEDHFGMNLGGPNRERRIKAKGHAGRGIDRVDYFEFWRYGSQDDFEGIVTHRLGHALADLCFNHRSGSASMPAWIGEGFGYWVSYEYISRNTVTCIAFSLPRYDRKADKEGVKPVERGMRAAFNALALASGPSLANLMRKKLVEMEGPDLAKAWSVVDFLIAKHPAQVRPLLRAACSAMRDGRCDLQRLRPSLHKLLAIDPGRDAYALLDEQWKEYASSSQMDERRRRRR